MSDADCLFCKIVARTVPATIVAESDTALAFRDIAPVAPTHVLVIPKDHFANVAAVAGAGDVDTGGLFRLCAEVASVEGIAETGYRMVANTGAASGQTVFHAHVHVIGGVPMGWPPG